MRAPIPFKLPFPFPLSYEYQKRKKNHKLVFMDNNLENSVIVGIALLLISIKLLAMFHPIPKLMSSFRNLFTTRRLQRDRQEAPKKMTTLVITMPSNSSTPNPTPMAMSPDTEPVHSHNKCTFVVGRGLVWEDLCPCDPTNL